MCFSICTFFFDHLLVGRCICFDHQTQSCVLSLEYNGRPHVANSIYWVVFPDLGIYYQKCHDDRCKSTVIRAEQPQLDHVTLDSNPAQEAGQEGTLLLRNSLLGTSAIIPVCGRGLVREIPIATLFFRQIQNLPQRQDTLVVRRLSENSVTRICISDLVVFGNETDNVYSVDSIDSDQDEAVLSGFNVATTQLLLCDGEMVQRLVLVGALMERKSNERTRSMEAVVQVKLEEEESSLCLPTQSVEPAQSTESSDAEEEPGSPSAALDYNSDKDTVTQGSFYALRPRRRRK